MNPFEFVIAIVAIVTIGNIIRTKQMARYGLRDEGDRGPFGRARGRAQRAFGGEDVDLEDTAETRRLREEVRALKDRIQTLERITVDKESSLSRQIDDLRDR
jgi:hypothetical protein